MEAPDYLVHPEKLRREADKSVIPWPGPRIHVLNETGKHKVVDMMTRFGIIAQAYKERMWKLQRQRVRSGLFAVSKPKRKLPNKRNGNVWLSQRLIINVVPANPVHADVRLGENDLMPSEAQFNNVHLRPLQLLLMSARDRRCFFYIFSLPGPWTSIFALCEEADASVFTPEALGKVPVGVRVCAMGWRYATALCQAAHRRMLLA